MIRRKPEQIVKLWMKMRHIAHFLETRRGLTFIMTMAIPIILELIQQQNLLESHVLEPILDK